MRHHHRLPAHLAPSARHSRPRGARQGSRPAELRESRQAGRRQSDHRRQPAQPPEPPELHWGRAEQAGAYCAAPHLPQVPRAAFPVECRYQFEPGACQSLPGRHSSAELA